MKKYIVLLLLIFSTSVAHAANTGWNPKPDGVHAKSPVIPQFLNQTAIDALSPTEGSIVYNTTENRNEWYSGATWSKFFDGLNSFGALVDDNTGLGVAYNLTTSFQTYTSYDITNNSSDITVSTSAGTVTIGSDSGGEYNIQADISVTGLGGVGLTFGFFSNITTELGTFDRGIGGVHFHPPVLINLTSDTGGAAYDTFSSIENLFFADSDVIQISEATSGTHPILFDMTFNDEVLYPTSLEFHGVLYDGSVAHEVEALMWNYSTTTWVGMRSAIKDFPDSGGTDSFRFYDREFAVPLPISSYVNVAAREAKARIDHTSTGSPGHQIRIDKVHLHDMHASAAISVNRILTIPGGSSLSFKIKSNLDLPAYFANVHFHVTKVSN